MSTVQEVLVACLPAVSSIISMVAIVVGIYKKFNDLISSVKDKTDQQELIDALQKNLEEDQVSINNLIDQNKQLSLEINEIVQKIDKIKK